MHTITNLQYSHVQRKGKQKIKMPNNIFRRFTSLLKVFKYSVVVYAHCVSNNSEILRLFHLIRHSVSVFC